MQWYQALNPHIKAGRGNPVKGKVSWEQARVRDIPTAILGVPQKPQVKLVPAFLEISILLSKCWTDVQHFSSGTVSSACLWPLHSPIHHSSLHILNLLPSSFPCLAESLTRLISVIIHLILFHGQSRKSTGVMWCALGPLFLLNGAASHRNLLAQLTEVPLIQCLFSS